MDEKLEEMLSGLAVKSLEGAEKAVQQIQVNAPGLMDEFLRWKFASAILTQALCAFFIFIIIFNAKKAVAWFNVYDDDSSKEGHLAASISYTVAGVFGSVMSAIILLCNFEWLQIWIAPRVYLIEYAMNLIKK